MKGETSQLVKKIINADPCVKECLSRGLINISELARRIHSSVSSQDKPPSVGSIKVALHRYSEKLKREKVKPSEKVLEVLAKSSLEIRTGITVSTIKIQALGKISGIIGQLLGNTRFMIFMQGLTSVTIISDKESYHHIRRRIENDDVIDEYYDQAVVIVVSPSEVIFTKGFIAYVTSILAENNINVNQIESVYTDTLFILSPSDAFKAFKLLDEVIGTIRREYGIM